MEWSSVLTKKNNSRHIGQRFLGNWDTSTWNKLIPYMKPRKFTSHEIVMGSQDAIPQIMVIEDGQLEALTPQGECIGTYSKGSVVGEQVFFDHHQRMLDYRALTNVNLHCLYLEDFEEFSKKEPKLAQYMLMELGKILALKMRQNTQY